MLNFSLDEVWYKSFRKYLESVQATGVLAGPDVEYYKQDPQYAKVKFSNRAFNFKSLHVNMIKVAVAFERPLEGVDGNTSQSIFARWID